MLFFVLGSVFIFFLTMVLAIVWLVTKRKAFAKAILYLWLIVAIFLAIISVLNFFTYKKQLLPEDIYGDYIIDRSKIPGKQADWQYNHYRFEITPQNEFYFHVTDKERVVKTYTGTVSFLEAYKCRLVLHVDSPAHHIMEEKPTLYREVWSFYYVFNSPKYGNVFFTKGKWKPIKN